ncbi:citramalate synthase [Metallumcola ferriviriculae]|uniref:Citramalate synthase n=1 Tax=Metallumcola ferriviriculae TaxID=3039180 RepID=A0AAU0UIZ7_9FIRM|nr:citramalate synthase [Desulfitibacteraceae bacterium MK1]
MAKVYVFDTTLRDGAQGEGISLTVQDKLKIAQKLEYLGVDYIEGGWPGSNPKDLEFFRRARELSPCHAKLTAFTSTRRPNTAVAADTNIQAVMESGVKTVALFGKSWDLHVLKALGTTLEENLAMIGETVAYFKENGLEVIYDAEHFFDAYKANWEYAMETIRAAAAGGADWLALCDTNGGSMPDEIAAAVSCVKETVEIPLGIHAHNDGEMAVANTLAAVKSGAVMVQGTINGLGERCGNANICSVVANLETKMGKHCLPTGHLERLTESSRYISEIANTTVPHNQAFVGKSSFAHKGGIHVSAVLKDSKTYEHIEPERVGNQRRVLVSELSGASNLLFKSEELKIDNLAEKEVSRDLIRHIKEMEYQGYQFEGAEASLELQIKKATNQYRELFQLESFKIMMEKRTNEDILSEAVIKLKVEDQVVHTAAEGNGPVNALDNALRKALEEFYPVIKEMHLTDYKVRVLDEKDGTGAKVRVLIESRDAHNSWSTVGVSQNIIEASWQALLDSMDYALLKQQKETAKSASAATHA